jgi:hypothetical protein
MSTGSTRTYGRVRAAVGGVAVVGVLTTAGCGLVSASDDELAEQVSERILADAVLIEDAHMQLVYSGISQYGLLHLWVGDAETDAVVAEVDQAVDTMWDVMDHEVFEVEIVLHDGRREAGERALPWPELDMRPLADELGENNPDQPHRENEPVRLTDSELDERYND